MGKLNWHRQLKEALRHEIDWVEWSSPKYFHQN